RLLLAHTGWATVVDPEGVDDLERSVIRAIGPQGGGYGYPPAGAPPMPSAPPPGMNRPGPAPTAGRPTTAAPGPMPGAQVRRWIEINGTRHQISRPTMVLGRSTEADVRIDDPGVSRRHCEIRTGTPSTIQDLGSTNGIVVDGQHTTRATLRDGSRIVVGSTTIVYRQAEG
ncbi:FHA domain-containing protein, partial [Streptomyces sp. NPDC001514]